MTYSRNYILWTATHYLITFRSFSNWNCPTFMVYSMHKVPVMLFSLSPSGHSTFLIRTLMLCGLPHIISPFPFIHFFSGELFHPFCITVTHGSCNTFSLFSSGHSTFLLPFESFMTHNQSCVVWTVICFLSFSQWNCSFFLVLRKVTGYSSIVSKWTLPLLFLSELLMIRSNNCIEWILCIIQSLTKRTYTAFFCMNVTQVLCKASPSSLNGPSVELFCSSMFDCNSR